MESFLLVGRESHEAASQASPVIAFVQTLAALFTYFVRPIGGQALTYKHTNGKGKPGCFSCRLHTSIANSTLHAILAQQVAPLGKKSRTVSMMLENSTIGTATCRTNEAIKQQGFSQRADYDYS